MFSFPSSPTVGQTSSQNGRTYEWSGYAWRIVGTVAGHAATHASSGSDAVTVAVSQVTGLQTALDAKAGTSHTHTASQITDFTSAVVAAAPPTTDASLLTAGTISEARLSFTPIHPFLLMGG